jgi:hypothetical protein
MQQELSVEGYDVRVVAVNSIDAVDYQDRLVEVATFPLFQDTDEVGAWRQHAGKKDDMYIYDADGRLVQALPIGGETPTRLHTDEGYAAVKAALQAAAESF